MEPLFFKFEKKRKTEKKSLFWLSIRRGWRHRTDLKYRRSTFLDLSQKAP